MDWDSEHGAFVEVSPQLPLKYSLNDSLFFPPSEDLHLLENHLITLLDTDSDGILCNSLKHSLFPQLFTNLSLFPAFSRGRGTGAEHQNSLLLKAKNK